MGNPALDDFAHQIFTKVLAVVIVGGIASIVLYELRGRFERWILRKAGEWKRARLAKRYDGMSEQEVLFAPHCPLCNGSMILRTAKRGENRGGRFWGCNGFPKCRGTRVA